MDRKLVLNILKELGKDIWFIVFPTLIILVIAYIVFTIAYLLVVFTGGNAPEISVWFVVPGILIVTSTALAGLYYWFDSAKLRAKGTIIQEEDKDA